MSGTTCSRRRYPYLLKVSKRMFDAGELEPIKTINPCPIELWHTPIVEAIHINFNENEATETALKTMKPLFIRVFTDVSATNLSMRAAAMIVNEENHIHYYK
ncbi:hypothetical protein RJ035_004980 [Blastomyces gilchristii]